MNKSIKIALIILAIIGVADSAYLTVSHYINVIPECSITQGCEQVLTSQYATVWGIPVALGGALYYTALFLLAFWYMALNDRRLAKYSLGVSGIGLIATLYLVYLQLFVINAICQFCMVSAVITLLFFSVNAYVLLAKNNQTV